ncbi:MAG TPA: M56 family metallopeptidase [Steroidobacteraceae bacterium]|nr:M56 family metallopeptidase [Steroidobacteraceae bacterium]
MSTHILAEAALRSLIMGAIIFAALRLLRVHQVRTQRTAWLIALAAALLMPALISWQIGPRLLPQFPAAALLQPVPAPEAQNSDATTLPTATAKLRDREVASGSLRTAHPLRAARPIVAIAASYAASYAAIAVYCIVAALLLIRLGFGVGFALRLLAQARRTTLQFAPQVDIRVSPRIATPVTIASTVLLPTTYSAWDEPTLRVVLTHECAHVRQRDFYVHVIAGLHCALFWFNPFSWWLKRQLSELGEALSDGAAVEQAQSRASYAEILLAFATPGPWPVAAVAMARSNSLAPRIERLLDDQGFEKSFSARPRQAFVAAGAVLLAMMASTSMVRVSAASPDAVSAAGAPTAPPAPTVPAAPPAPAAPTTRPQVRIDAKTATDVSTGGVSVRPLGDEILAIRVGDSRLTFDWGSGLPQIAGDYIYYQHDGKTYLIQDPETIANARRLLAPMEELGRMQQELGRQQAAMGKQQKMLRAEQLVAKVETPDFKRDMAELEREMRKMDLEHLAPQIDQKALAELQSRLGEIQGRVGALMAELGMQQAKLGERQGALGEQQGKLGEARGRLGEQRRKIAEEARRQLRPLIEQAIRDGLAKPID